MTRLFLVRHGAVAEAWRGRAYGCLEVPLSSHGEAEARRAARALAGESLAAVISSGLSRAEFGAECLREPRGLARIDDPDLREIDRGEWAGRSLEALAREEPGAWDAWHRDPERLRPPGGESLGDLAERVFPRLDHWSRRHAGEALAIVAHSWVIRVALCRTKRLPFDRAPEIDVATGEIFQLEWPDAVGDLGGTLVLRWGSG